jgi:hypothetical protein
MSFEDSLFFTWIVSITLKTYLNLKWCKKVDTTFRISLVRLKITKKALDLDVLYKYITKVRVNARFHTTILKRTIKLYTEENNTIFQTKDNDHLLTKSRLLYIKKLYNNIPYNTRLIHILVQVIFYDKKIKSEI